ncbi:HNH endonuclease (plasmid) [Clostridium botulinum]|uniref:HNH endonuclease n=2 Tax=Clostridium botulinum TaxID=1491 RepID=UPI00068E44ED|nr:HNH endonuclease [Clostridium botulinum]MCD3232524.1 HNH endonuclease [Clostridium botulinum D/C]MCD3265933.1 HNH endonuclease [Clostridium botulinum D/C]MCD3312922.1 HNH endonuclease [Clostridium botulinum D/C]MCD3316090.1 HNH endonuclease [Clostridium botulinum D/C]MCD3321166.1 HNH endonuclease [Clostridium botulinum D/C]
MVIDKVTKMKINNFNVDLYKGKGYQCNIGDTVNIDIKDVSAHSKNKIKIQCDKCKTNIKEITIASLHHSKSYQEGNYICYECKEKILPQMKCEVCGSTHKVTNYLNEGNLLCQRHQRILRKKGDIKRTIYDPNEIHIYEDYAEFDTYDINGDINGIFKIDLDVVNFVKSHKIYKHKDGYACYKFKDKNNKTKNMRLHRYIMNVHNAKDKSIIVDHINRDKQDNRRHNLRLATFKDNVVNTGMFSTNTSGHKGISWNKQRKTWEVYIHQYNKKIGLGYYKDYDKAVKVREIAEIIYFGSNNPEYNKLIKKYIDNPKIQHILLNHREEYIND